MQVPQKEATRAEYAPFFLGQFESLKGIAERLISLTRQLAV
jgi:hypothetical protein